MGWRDVGASDARSVGSCSGHTRGWVSASGHVAALRARQSVGVGHSDGTESDTPRRGQAVKCGRRWRESRLGVVPWL